ncbi:unnamed protein product [Adineta steineri]|uniref:Uncharacterized protein n=1 Tax=Adineta steineri TaxID=433720 RepID=A0A815M8N0_9BILA|nr:unnamed protein product [Adineta steineri]CAF1416719.1 unnamed protein product [Adineta steineri]CAF1619100.1 unnamed protein product [Adineta steineri]CAF1619322.1 unnamed protein product [Adineta steineri]
MNNSSFQICTICVEENIVKPKLGIHPCHGCQFSFCLIHLTKHRQELLQKLDSIIMQRDEIFETIFNNLNISNDNIKKSLKDNDEWETKMHEEVHEIAEQNRDRIRLEYSKQFNELKDRYALFTKELIDKRDNDDFFEYDIEQLSIKLEQFKQEVYEININLQLNHLDWSRLIHINEQEDSPISSYLNNSKLLFERQVISLHDRNCFFLAASNTYILAYILSINRNENRLVLYSTLNGNELCSTELDIRLGNVCDMIYVDKLNHCFLVVCRQAILIYEPEQMVLTNLSDIKPIDEHPFWSIAISYDTNDAFISLDSNGYIERWSIETHPNWVLIKRWNINEILQNIDQGIRMIRICETKNQLAIVILQQNRYWRIDLYDFNLKLIRYGRELILSNDIDKFSFGCRLIILPDNETWLLTERTTHSLWYANDLTVKQIDKHVHSACLIINNNNQQRKIVVSYSNDPKRIEIFNL